MYLSMDMDHNAVVTKVNGAPYDGERCHKPGGPWLAKYIAWLRTGIVLGDAGPRVRMAEDPQVSELLQLTVDLELQQRLFRAELQRRYQVEQAHQLTYDQAGEMLLGRFPAGSLFGEVGFFDGAPRTATVRAELSANVLRVSREAFERLRLTDAPLATELALELGRTIASHFRERLARYHDTTREP